MVEPILALQNNEGMYILDTDASEFGLGAVLSQQQDNEERVTAYSSRAMSRSELKYETTRKELLAVVNGLKQFRQYCSADTSSSEQIMLPSRGLDERPNLCRNWLDG